jgi:ADP-ribose pyrophosphatase YjhB (NUDIX family)
MKQAEFHTDYALAPKPNKPRRVGVAAALFHGGRVLMEYHTDSDFWAFVSGGVRDDESVLTAALREIGEETSGAVPVDLALYAVYSNPGRITAYPDGNVSQIITFAFVGDLVDDAVAASEESRELRFFEIDALASLGVAPTHREFARDLSNLGRDRERVAVD